MTSSRWFQSTSVPTRFVAARVCLFGRYDFSNQHSSFLNTLYGNDDITLYCVKMCYYCRSRYARKSLAAGRVKRPWQWPSLNCSCRRRSALSFCRRRCHRRWQIPGNPSPQIVFKSCGRRRFSFVHPRKPRPRVKHVFLGSFRLHLLFSLFFTDRFELTDLHLFLVGANNAATTQGPYDGPMPVTA